MRGQALLRPLPPHLGSRIQHTQTTNYVIRNIQILPQPYWAGLVTTDLCEVMFTQRCGTYLCILSSFSVPAMRVEL